MPVSGIPNPQVANHEIELASLNVQGSPEPVNQPICQSAPASPDITKLTSLRKTKQGLDQKIRKKRLDLDFEIPCILVCVILGAFPLGYGIEHLINKEYIGLLLVFIGGSAVIGFPAYRAYQNLSRRRAENKRDSVSEEIKKLEEKLKAEEAPAIETE